MNEGLGDKKGVIGRTFGILIIIDFLKWIAVILMSSHCKNASDCDTSDMCTLLNIYYASVKCL